MHVSDAVIRHRFTTEEYHRMGEAGILSEDDRVELIDGEILERSPIGPAHMQCVLRLTRLLHRHLDRAERSDLFVSVQNPLRLNAHSEPEPDLALLQLSGELDAIPGPDAAKLVVEVADRTLAYDRAKAKRYAQAGVPETWIVAVAEKAVEVYRTPTDEGYADRSRMASGDSLTCAAVPELEPIPVAAIV